MGSLKKLFLNSNRIGNAGMISLSEAIGKGLLASIILIDPNNNNATEAGEKHMLDVAGAHGTYQNKQYIPKQTISQ
jgi:hypothetical protein